MASRPAWKLQNNRILENNFEFQWNPGFSIVQKKRNVTNLHEAISESKQATALEISTKSDVDLGYALSAFNLKLDGITLENVFQSHKVYENGGPFLDLLHVEPKLSKRDARHQTSGKLQHFYYNDEMWLLEPKTAFYDYIYISAVKQTFTLDELQPLFAYEYFTDIEFNPQKSINCQAKTIVTLKQLILENRLHEDFTMETWVAFCCKMNGTIVDQKPLNYTQMTLDT